MKIKFSSLKIFIDLINFNYMFFQKILTGKIIAWPNLRIVSVTISASIERWRIAAVSVTSLSSSSLPALLTAGLPV